MERFWRRVDKINGPVCEHLGTRCWPWLGGQKSGYGVFRFNGRPQGSHRVAWILTHGPLPEWTGDMKTTTIVRHHCDFPLCCNLEHLAIGTQSDNARDRKSRGRAIGPRGVRNGNARLSSEQVEQVFALRSAGRTQKEVAAALGISQPHVSDIENRKKRRTG